MSFADPKMLMFFFGISLFTAAIAVQVAQWLAQRARAGPRPHMWRAHDMPCSYTFRDGYLLSDVEEDDPFLADREDRLGAWTALAAALVSLNAEIGDRMQQLRDRGQVFVLTGHIGGDALSITGRRDGEMLVITVAVTDPKRARRRVDKASLDALEVELHDLRHGMDNCPVAMWLEDTTGQITWANAAYFDLLRQVTGGTEAFVWPIRALFSDHAGPPPDPGTMRRCALNADREEAMWFDISATNSDRGLLFSARPIGRLVAAETALRNFVQTLSKTFAHLTTGLAIFDRDRRLVLFNPALLTLSTLDAEWLSSRPDLFAFLDQLRERQRMPEPKNYKAWRAGLGALEQAARDGTYQELWTLPTGQTYRVIGRPHPDGAVAFLFDDISSEVSLTRKFRADLDLYREILDASTDAMAVFSAEGACVLSNSAYAQLWGHDPETQLCTASLQEATGHWQTLCAPSPVWGDLRDFASRPVERTTWRDHVTLKSGAGLECRFSPLRGGATLVGFQELSAAPEEDVPVMEIAPA